MGIRQTTTNTDGGHTDIPEHIAIHTSDTATFKKCRRRWDWTSTGRGNLRPKVAMAGINFNLTYGTAFHDSLEYYYSSKLEKRPEYAVDEVVEHFQTYWTALGDKVKKANEGWWTENKEEFEYHLDLGEGMLRHYLPWAQEHDEFRVVAIEHPFKVDTGLRARNPHTGDVLPVYYCGRMDMIVQKLSTGTYGVVDHKTSSRHEDEDYKAKLDMDEQVTRYMWAAELEAEQYDLEYKRIDFVYYNVLFKAYPKPPTITSRGVPSIDRQNEMTTAPLFARTVMADEDLQMWIRTNDKAQAYYDWLKEVGDRRFIMRDEVFRSRKELRANMQNALWEIEDMLRMDLHIYPNATGDWYCIKCQFRGPCIATNDGSDVDYMLSEMYEQNMDDEGHYSVV